MTTKHQTPNLEQIQNLKSLAASIAHETRNPLAAIQGCCEVIRDNLNQAMEFVEMVVTASSRGLSVIDLILANVREEKFDESKFVDLSMREVVYKALKEFAFENDEEKKLVYIDLRQNFHFKGDETLMIYVLFNLIKNSLYHKARIEICLKNNKRRSGSKIREKVEVAENLDAPGNGEKVAEESYNYLYFKDNGMGITKDKLPHIFDNFFTSDKKGGTGLGLPFCKRVMEAFGGDISCKSQEYEGVEFCLRFKVD